MKLVILALWDEKIEAFMTPFFAQSVGAGIRSLADMVNGSGGEPPAQHPEDFKLFSFGEWYVDGMFVLSERPQLVAECSNLKTGRN